MSKTKTSSRPTIPGLAKSTIKDYLSQIERDEFLPLMILAEEALALSAWLAGDEMGIERIFELCKELTLGNLKRRLDYWQSKVAASQTHHKTVH